jgi:hypothetical protein
MSIIFSLIFTIIMSIYSCINYYIYYKKNIEYMNSMDIIINENFTFDLKTIISIIIRNGYLFIINIIILTIIFFIIELGFAIYKKAKLRITGR